MTKQEAPLGYMTFEDAIKTIVSANEEQGRKPPFVVTCNERTAFAVAHVTDKIECMIDPELGDCEVAVAPINIIH